MARLKVFHWKEIQDWQEFSNCLYFSVFDSFYFNPLRERIYPLEYLNFSGNVLSVKLSKKGFAHAKLLRFLGNTMNFYLSKVNRSFIEIYSTLWSLWWVHNRMETMRIPTTMKITRRKKKKEKRSLWNWNIVSTIIACLKMGSHFVDYSIFRNGYLRDSPPFYILFFVPWISNDRWNVSRSKKFEKRIFTTVVRSRWASWNSWRGGFIRANNYCTLTKKSEEARGQIGMF